MKTTVRIALVALLMSPAIPMVASAQVGFTARIADGGLPVTGAHDFVFTFYDALTNGTQVGDADPQTGVTVTDGVVSVTLSKLTAAVASANPTIYLEITYDGTVMSPRIAVLPVPYALSMNRALDCQTLYSDEVTLAASGGTCPTSNIGGGNICLSIMPNPPPPCNYCHSPACPDGYTVTGGGFGQTSATAASIFLNESRPNTVNGWAVRLSNPTAGAVPIRVYARCCKVP